MQTCTLLSFDLDGTLLDTAGEIAESANRTLNDFGLPRRCVADISRHIGHGTRQLMLRTLAEVLLERPSLADQLPVDKVLERMEFNYGLVVGSAAVPYPGAREALRRLAEAGVRIACVTNKEQRHANRLLQATRLADHFDVIVGGDTLPEKKPHPSVLVHAMRLLNAHPSATAHVGDSRIDVETARAAGVESWAVPYGYNGGVPIESAGPDRLFRGLADVASHALGLLKGRPGTPSRSEGQMVPRAAERP